MIAVSQVLREYPIPLSLQASSPQRLCWVKRLRRRPDSNRCIKVLQTSPLPLGYVAEVLPDLIAAEKKSPATWWDWGRRGHFIEEVKIQRRLVRLPRAPCPEGQSGKRDSNPRLRPWQGRTLPLSYSRSAPACAGGEETYQRRSGPSRSPPEMAVARGPRTTRQQRCRGAGEQRSERRTVRFLLLCSSARLSGPRPLTQPSGGGFRSLRSRPRRHHPT